MIERLRTSPTLHKEKKISKRKMSTTALYRGRWILWDVFFKSHWDLPYSTLQEKKLLLKLVRAQQGYLEAMERDFFPFGEDVAICMLIFIYRMILFDNHIPAENSTSHFFSDSISLAIQFCGC